MLCWPHFQTSQMKASNNLSVCYASLPVSHSLPSLCFFQSFSLPVSLLCLCSFAMLMLGKWEVATHTDTCTASVLIISKRTASSLSLSGTVQCIPRGKKEMNALRALIQLVHVQINKECNILPMTENGI